VRDSMRSVLTHTERDRRWAALSAAMGKDDLDALVVVANDYNGHRGGLRYVADYHLAAFYSYVVLPRGGEATVVLPMACVGCTRSSWIGDYRFTQNMIGTLVDVLEALPSRDHIGIVGMSQIMRVEDYLHLVDRLPGTQFTDASALFEKVRAQKSPEEVAGIEEAAYIADECLALMIEIARPGVTTRELTAEAFKKNAALGGKDPIFLTMDATVVDGESMVRWSQASDTVVSPSDLFTFSFEMIGPSGYWVELARMMTFAPVTEDKAQIHAAVSATMQTAYAGLRPGVPPEEVQRDMIATSEAHETRVAYWLGHGIGQDVIEAPWLGREVIQAEDATRSTDLVVTENMAFAVHPWLLSARPGLAGYMADTVVAAPEGARILSRYPLDLIQV
jgi:Xaa-Pro aminopeptidase